jgi:hypothetical protein
LLGTRPQPSCWAPVPCHKPCPWPRASSRVGPSGLDCPSSDTHCLQTVPSIHALGRKYGTLSPSRLLWFILLCSVSSFRCSGFLSLVLCWHSLLEQAVQPRAEHDLPPSFFLLSSWPWFTLQPPVPMPGALSSQHIDLEILPSQRLSPLGFRFLVVARLSSIQAR